MSIRDNMSKYAEKMGKKTTDEKQLTPAQKRQLRLMKELHSDRVDVEQPEDIIKCSLEKGGMLNVAKVFSVVKNLVPERPKPLRKRASPTTTKRTARVSETDSSSDSSSDSEVLSISLSAGTIDKALNAIGKSNKRDLTASSSDDEDNDDDNECSSDSGEKVTYTLLQSMPDAKRLRKSTDGDNKVVKEKKVAKAIPMRGDRRPSTPPPPPPLPVLESESEVQVDLDQESVVQEEQVVVAPVKQVRMASFNLGMLRQFAGNKPIKIAFIDRIMACSEVVDALGIDISGICHTDFEESAFYALVNAIVPMRFSGSSLVNEVREVLTPEQAAAMHTICVRMQLPYDLYVTANYIVPMEDFTQWVFRPCAWGWDGALSFNINTGKARFWTINMNRFQIGRRSWQSLSLSHPAPAHMYADGATEFDYTYNADTKTITLLGTPTIDDLQLVREGDNFMMRCGDVSVLFRNTTLLNTSVEPAAPAAAIQAAVTTTTTTTESLVE